MALIYYLWYFITFLAQQRWSTAVFETSLEYLIILTGFICYHGGQLCLWHVFVTLFSFGHYDVRFFFTKDVIASPTEL